MRGKLLPHVFLDVAQRSQAGILDSTAIDAGCVNKANIAHANDTDTKFIHV